MSQVRHLEVLEERAQPSATPTVNLTTAGAQGTVNGAIYSQSQLSNTGSLDEFLCINTHRSGCGDDSGGSSCGNDDPGGCGGGRGDRGHGGNRGHGGHRHGPTTEEGFNTDARPVPLDDRGGSDTHAIRLNDVPVVTVNGVAYREFVLSVNQSSSSPLLSLDQLRVYLGDKGNLTGYNPHTGKLDGLSPVYQLNGRNGRDWVELNGALQHAQGTGSAYVYIPDALFQTTANNPNPYVYLYSKFGEHQGANGGDECWSVGKPPSSPPPTLASVAGYVYADNNNNGVRESGEVGIQGVSVTLTDANGNVVGTAFTDVNGAYSFTGLQPGTYTVTKNSTPTGYLDGKVSAGTVNGSVDGSVGAGSIFGISLAAGQAGTEYDFGEIHTG